jgi:predicted DNA-binding transcriptional regulator AlpA
LYLKRSLGHPELRMDEQVSTPTAQAPFAKKAAALKASSSSKAALSPELIAGNEKHRAKAGLAPYQPAHRKHDAERVHGARAPPGVRLLSKSEVLAITHVSFPTIWSWMRAGKFPRSRIVGGKSMWLSSEIERWLSALPLRPLKGDTPEAAA